MASGASLLRCASLLLDKCPCLRDQLHALGYGWSGSESRRHCYSRPGDGFRRSPSMRGADRIVTTTLVVVDGEIEVAGTEPCH
jgi:hypothetical protein